MGNGAQEDMMVDDGVDDDLVVVGDGGAESQEENMVLDTSTVIVANNHESRNYENLPSAVGGYGKNVLYSRAGQITAAGENFVTAGKTCLLQDEAENFVMAECETNVLEIRIVQPRDLGKYGSFKSRCGWRTGRWSSLSACTGRCRSRSTTGRRSTTRTGNGKR
jgi:hypothetical protein